MMNHKIIIGMAQKMEQVKSASVSLTVTSPPYPMIEMWDDILACQNPKIKTALEKNEGQLAFELMHQELDKVWAEISRVTITGGFVCINIGDATRTLNKEFALYPNHSRIISSFLKLGFTNLPNIIWRKQTNAPNKFMGAGMLPAGAYVTLEHKWILVFRKGLKRQYATEAEKHIRKQSSFFWEERNVWFSDLWELKGVKQKVKNSITRDRSGAYPFEIPYRLINMFSLKGDTILDPFLGTGTTMSAAIASERNSIGYEIDNSFLKIISENINDTQTIILNNTIYARLNQHKLFIAARSADNSKNEIKHFNRLLNLPVMTSQETEISFSLIHKIQSISCNEFFSAYEKMDLNVDYVEIERKPISQMPLLYDVPQL